MISQGRRNCAKSSRGSVGARSRASPRIKLTLRGWYAGAGGCRSIDTICPSMPNVSSRSDIDTAAPPEWVPISIDGAGLGFPNQPHIERDFKWLLEHRNVAVLVREG